MYLTTWSIYPQKLQTKIFLSVTDSFIHTLFPLVCFAVAYNAVALSINKFIH